MGVSSKQGVIGGVFGIEETPNLNNYCTPPFMKDQSVLLVNARSGISLLLEMLSPHNIWVPSYLCGAILQAVDERTTSVRFYETDYNLTFSSVKWTEDVQPNDVV